MNIDASEARRILLVRAFEDDAAVPLSPAGAAADAARWTREDAAWASAEALRQVGEKTSADRWFTVRSALACERLVQRQPRLALLLQPAAATSGWLMAALLGLALLAGLASDVIGPSNRINILAPPLLAVMGWNLAVYALLLLNAARRRHAGSAQSADRAQSADTIGRLLRTAGALAERIGARRPGIGSPQGQEFAAAWRRASVPLQSARLATLLHLAALAVAAGALLALYARGMVFEYRAGWDSTFLDAATVHRWLHTLLAPALAITGANLPDPLQLDALRFSRSAGENAARWIHWYAITTALVMAPRLLLAAWAMRRSRRLQRHFPLALEERYYQRLFQWLAHSRDQASHLAIVLPYANRSAAAMQTRLAAHIDTEFGPGLQVRILPEVPLGAEDELAADWPRSQIGGGHVDLLLPLFAITATPELETHGRFITLLLSRCAAIDGKPRCRVMIDESGFRKRLAGAGLQDRLQQRRLAWQKLLDSAGAGEALFVDLSADPETVATDR